MTLPNNPPQDIISDIRSSIRRWNILYPLDKWYRNKYDIRFNSEEHLSIDIMDIRMEYEEEFLYREAAYEEFVKSERYYNPGTGQWLSKQQAEKDLTNQEIDDIYQSVDLSKLDGDDDTIKINME